MTWNIISHEWAVRLLQQHLRSSQQTHAYLFCGAPGVGRRTLALRFAQALNCSNPPEPAAVCGNCRACTLTRRMQHPDLSVVEAEQEGGMIRVEQVRELQRSLSLAPYEARYRVALLLRFHEANANAQNALLKTLEEAPPRVILLLTADTPESLLPTISSRCEILRLRPMPLTQLAGALERHHEIPAEKARLLAHLAAGRVGDALRLHQNPERMQRRLDWQNDLLTLLSENQRRRFAYAEAFTKDRQRARYNLRPLLQAWQSLWRDALLAASGSTAPLINLDYEAQVRRLAASLGNHPIQSALQGLQEGLQMLESNINARLLLEVMLLDLPHLDN